MPWTVRALEEKEMKKEDLKVKFEALEKQYRNYKANNTEMFNLQYDTNKLFMEIINDFNEKTGLYNKLLLICNVIIGILTVVMTIATILNIIILYRK
ncbi:MAG: hypothetical protein PHW54_01530 [Candidatus Omnitrophica bacterium]|nr:hypothetical protein [Candidatus Omnitrophota bacterium]